MSDFTCPSGIRCFYPIGILTFICMINTTSENLKARKIFIFQHFRFNEQLKFHAQLICLFDLILYVLSTIFQLCSDGSSWVEPVLSEDKCVLLKDHKAVTLVRLKPAAPWSRVKHSTTEPLRSPCSVELSMKKVL